MSRPQGVICWEGPSQFTGGPVQVLVSCLGAWKSRNTKTGNMVQASIVHSGVNPTLTFGTPREKDTCGECRLGGGAGAGRVCYAAMQAWLSGRAARTVPRYTVEGTVGFLREAGRPMRVGSYGDPAAVPLEVWARLLTGVDHWTGFTHAWRRCDPGYRTFLMASCDSQAEVDEAAALGYRTFRVRPRGGPLRPDEVLCPNESSGVKCERCNLCRGAGPQKNVAVTVHGLGWRRFREAT